VRVGGINRKIPRRRRESDCGGRQVIAAAILCVGLLTAWGCFALWFQAPGRRLPRGLGTILRGLAVCLWGWFGIVIVVALTRGVVALSLAGFGLVFAALLFWWRQILPSNDREWADDVARMTTGIIAADRVTLRNVRHFDWRTRTDYIQRWETRVYDLRRLNSLDMILSYWSMPAIAHVLISFGFDDGEHVVFSVEIRREKTESFSEIGGFFKEFELSIIACDERCSSPMWRRRTSWCAVPVSTTPSQPTAPPSSTT
jgi:hypothetical protein